MNRGDFDGHWLIPSAPLPQYTKFSHRPVAEVPGMRDVAKPFVGQAIVDHHLHRQLVADRLQDLGYPQTAAAIRDELPKSDRTRKGNFGEVIASEHLVQRYGYLMPVFKLRFRDHPNLPMRGEDVIAFVRDTHGAITKVCVGEAKVIVAFAHQTVEKAHERLAYTYPLTRKPFTSSFPFCTSAEIMLSRATWIGCAIVSQVAWSRRKTGSSSSQMTPRRTHSSGSSQCRKLCHRLTA